MAWSTIVLTVVVLVLPASINGLKCYSCQSSGDLDPRCERDPLTVASNNPIINCEMKYCTIKRVEFLEPLGRLRSFYRGCEERPIYTNRVVYSADSVTYYTACQTDLCNGGLGVDVGSGGGSGGGWLEGGSGGTGEGGVIVAPGLGAGTVVRFNYVLAIVMAVIALIVYG